ncbi:hypothetical protein BDP27DRAFT_1366052 [Rhodocollybia butyracea]|uniref:Uncharacterized protein n=1 Tax=Rhodocollybia butyracea TaxID=206335 RepID=A0A9P5U5K5_9AGAR|nr:hypothetical protein BDP27DRAFT_1366052 [Rhodocollybia butyracea]
MTSANPQTPRRSMRLKRKSSRLEGDGNASPAPKRTKRECDHDDSRTPSSISASTGPSTPGFHQATGEAGPSSGTGSGSSDASPCYCTLQDRQQVLIKACNRLAILCEDGDLDWSLLFAMQGLYRPLERRIQAWEAEPVPVRVEDGRAVFESGKSNDGGAIGPDV